MYSIQKYEEYWEPIVIVPANSPTYDERFVGYGFTRNSFVSILLIVEIKHEINFHEPISSELMLVKQLWKYVYFAQIYELHAKGYTFRVLDDAFFCHWGFQKGSTRPRYRAQEINVSVEMKALVYGLFSYMKTPMIGSQKQYFDLLIKSKTDILYAISIGYNDFFFQWDVFKYTFIVANSDVYKRDSVLLLGNNFARIYTDGRSLYVRGYIEQVRTNRIVLSNPFLQTKSTFGTASWLGECSSG